MNVPDLSRIANRLAESGLILRGGFNFVGEEARPCDPSGMPARAVLLIGNAGAAHWSRFTQWRKAQPATLSNPLDSWARMVIDTVAREVGAKILMPNDRPFAPFQQWAMRAEGLAPSPLGILIHPVYGLWHAYRGALLFDAEVSLHEAGKQLHPCDLCHGKPCLNACPIGAFSGAGFAYEACKAHVRSPRGAACREGCLARNACPLGTEYRYPVEAQTFHQNAFAGISSGAAVV